MAKAEYQESEVIVRQPTVSVVIPHWNKKAYLAPCLEALAKQTYRDFEIVIVDNGSTDGSAEFIEATYPDAVLVKRPRNFGFTGINAGIRLARGRYVAALNNDALADPDWLKHLVARMETSGEIGMVTSKILKLHNDGKPAEFDSTGDFYHIWGRPHPRGRDEVDEGQYDRAEQVFGASGGATLYRVSMLRQIGLFDEDFFAYYEDVDLSFRARLAGYQVWYEPEAVVNHKVGGTSGGGASAFSRYQSVKNQWYVYLKDMPAPLFWKYLPRFLFLQFLFYGNAFLTHLAWPHTKSALTALVMTPSMLLKRFEIQNNRKLTVAEVDSLLLRSVPPGVGHNFRKYFGWIMRDDQAK